MELKGRDVISLKDFNREEIEYIFKVALEFDLVASKKRSVSLASGKILASLFFEPSTRTRLSFETAMLRLGGGVIGFAEAAVSRAGDHYGESISDTVRMIDRYADIIAVRHLTAGTAAEMAKYSDIPVLNAGDGNNEHPTQALQDMYTIFKYRGQRLDGLKILLMGGMNYRVMHSLCYALPRFLNIEIFSFSSEDTRMPAEIVNYLKSREVFYKEIKSIEEVIDHIEVIEQIGPKRNKGDFIEDKFILNREKLNKANPNLLVLHPLPRIGELSEDVDSTQHAGYFEQAGNGVPLRMALIACCLGLA
jgi:aspartate carbamoyltransferase catalytic subunit